MQSGARQLRDWIKRRGLNQAQAAEMFGFHEAFVSMLVNGRRTPSLDNAVLIEQFTGIPVSAWSSSRVRGSEATAPAAAAKPKR